MNARNSIVLALALTPLLASCSARAAEDLAAEAPPPPVVEHDGDSGIVRADHPEQFPIATAGSRAAAPELNVTGVVSPDVSRSVPVLSLASGRIIDVRARLGDRVQKGQVLLRIESADVSSAVSDYRKATADQELAQRQLDRSADLYERGAVAKKDLEVAQDAAQKARVDAQNARERLRILGLDPEHAASGIVTVIAPVSGVITEQNVAPAGGVRSLDNSPNLFTISDLSHVWILCDVFENDLPMVRVGDTAAVRLVAYPDRVLNGRISNIGAVLDPAIRTAKVRIEVENPGVMRVGMFVNATFQGRSTEVRAVIPASAILHLHDREWVYVPGEHGRFVRREVKAGQMLPGRMQEVTSGLSPGERVVANALVLQNTVEQ